MSAEFNSNQLVLFHKKVSQLFTTKAWLISTALSPMELWLMRTEWLRPRYQPNWNSHQSGQDPQMQLMAQLA